VGAKSQVCPKSDASAREKGASKNEGGEGKEFWGGNRTVIGSEKKSYEKKCFGMGMERWSLDGEGVRYQKSEQSRAGACLIEKKVKAPDLRKGRRPSRTKTEGKNYESTGGGPEKIPDQRPPRRD